jgi:very-short-patch-repair endonuclease
VASGSARLRAAIDRLDETAGNNRVEHERRLISLINGSHIPKAANNVRLAGHEVDVHWIGTRAIVEADSDAYHSSPAQIAADIEKQRFLRSLGFVFLLVLWKQTNYEPEATLARIERFRLENLAPPVPGIPPELR